MMMQFKEQYGNFKMDKETGIWIISPDILYSAAL